MTCPPRGRIGRRAGGAPAQSGQATAELALVLPAFVLLVLALFQVALVARDQVAVVHAARAAAREASVDPSGDRAQAAAHRVVADADVRVLTRGRVGERVIVSVRHVARTDLPLIGPLFPDPVLTARAEMRVER